MQSRRPLAITVVCIIRFLAFGVSLYTVPALYDTLTAAYGTWYGSFLLASIAR